MAMEARREQQLSDAIPLIRCFLECNVSQVRIRYGIEWDVEAALLLDEAQLKDGTSVVFLEYVDGNPAGVLVAARNKEFAELKRMYVCPEHRRRGIGRSLLQQALAWARSGGYSHVRLYSARYLQPSHFAYSDAGFKEIEAYPESGVPGSLTRHFVFMELRF